ncbi:universal stress protein [Erwinia sp. OLTSP20]|uniref:universal stress protein n=1 Tax=unclassified Erwinia TaxID=2622719 RepID=UPI000C173F58|nr:MULTISPECIES: universal stress protein [unclassified Erwinia]PIJ51606.1 universal stress protein [Erwinia sp. OAMSP11]PIJ75907.1 universal stress protein [Erwinia sp. OLSSP12]PIJ83517.1 universal stress protein [Erwinia sp. OLCASP19]PIJ86350.1 universal stress protein [Erwinia sp. OLMTSP26]PIJ88530.1 universal stress protein [Erwinia sp. OLMDSP33]
MKTLLVAIDSSAIAGKVVSLAAQQALALNAQVVVVCCVDEKYCSLATPLELAAGETFDAALSSQDEQNGAESVVRQALARLRLAGVAARGRVVAGEAAITIVEQARALDAEMIIMGRRHLTPFNRLLKGSVSAAVIEQAHCPVMIDVRADR